MRREIIRFRKEQTSLREKQVKLGEDSNEMLKMLRSMDLRLERIERMLEKLTLSIEEEAKSILEYRVKRDLGLEMKIESLILPEIELNIYGVSDDTCIVGEACVRAGVRVLERLLKKIEKLRRKFPEKLRKRIIPVIYTSLPLPGLVERAKVEKIWVLKATEDIVKPDFNDLSEKDS